MFSIILKVFTIYTLRNGSHMMVFGQLGTSMRLIGPYVWVYLLDRVHLRCFEKIWVDDVEHEWVKSFKIEEPTYL